MAKQSPTKNSKKAVSKVDFEPNKMGFAIAALSAVSLLLLAVIATQS